VTNPQASRWFVAGIVVCLGAVGAALVSQHVFDMQPCPWCVLQRLIFVVIAAACVLGLLWRGRVGRSVAAVIALLACAGGVAAAVWQNQVAAQTESCVQTLADRIMNATGLDGLLPDVFQARASCIDAAVDLFGVPYEFYSLALFVVLGAGAVAILRRG
jgi:disulfide bond formation protein DsbB